MIFGPNELPGMPQRDKIFVRRDLPQEQSEGGIWIPDKAQQLATFGYILSAGLDALDKMHDNGGQIGDYIWFGKFASVLGEWDRYETEPKADCEHEWSRGQGKHPEWLLRFECEKCGVGRIKESIAVMSADDILVNQDAEKRIREGKMRVSLGKTSEGATQHFIQRAPYPVAPIETVTTTTTTASAAQLGGFNGRS